MNPVSERYTNALLEVAIENKEVKILKDEVVDIIPFLDADLLKIFTAYNISKDDKKILIKDLFKDFNKTLINFMCLLVDMNRIGLIKEIFKDYLHVTNEYLNIKEVRLISARVIDKDLKDKLLKSLKDKLNSEIEIIEEIDERLISGIKIIIDDKVVDLSMQKKINEMRKTLLERW